MAATPITNVNVEAQAATNDYNLQADIDDGVILQAWNWSFDTIKQKLPEIAEAGYTAVQTSPIQGTKENSMATANAGNKLDMTFDNSKDIVTITFKGETAELTAQKAASGIWYKNDHLELIGKGNDITLSKDDQVIFKHQDDKVAIETKSDKGDVLNMTFNNTEGTVKAYLNGGEQIDLVEQKSASGIWYKNDHYELTGKGDKYELQKDGKTVFKN